jgi:hypothetical protein
LASDSEIGRDQSHALLFTHVARLAGCRSDRRHVLSMLFMERLTRAVNPPSPLLILMWPLSVVAGASVLIRRYPRDWYPIVLVFCVFVSVLMFLISWYILNERL